MNQKKMNFNLIIISILCLGFIVTCKQRQTLIYSGNNNAIVVDSNIVTNVNQVLQNPANVDLSDSIYQGSDSSYILKKISNTNIRSMYIFDETVVALGFYTVLTHKIIYIGYITNLNDPVFTKENFKSSVKVVDNKKILNGEYVINESYDDSYLVRNIAREYEIERYWQETDKKPEYLQDMTYSGISKLVKNQFDKYRTTTITFRNKKQKIEYYKLERMEGEKRVIFAIEIHVIPL